jgi:hypothetical protein
MARYLSLILSLLVSGLAWAETAWPLRVSSDGKHLEDQSGKPFLVVGDASWSLATELTPTEAIEYLDDRVADGFNTINFGAIWRHVPSSTGTFNYANQHPFAGGSSDWSVPNEDYWQHVDWLLNEAKSRGMLVLLWPAYLGYNCGNEGWCQQMLAQSDATMSAYGTFIGNRYGSQGNIIWMHGGDADATDYGADSKVNAIANAILAADTGNHLASARPGPNESAREAYDEPWLDINTIYWRDPCPQAGFAADVYQEYSLSSMPILQQEGRYEDEDPQNDIYCMTDQMMWSVLGGAVGHVYGHTLVWRYASGWKPALDDTGSTMMGNARALMESTAWWEFVPDTEHTAVTGGYRSGADYVLASRSSSGANITAYLPTSGTTITVDMTRIVGSAAVARWYYPISGVFSHIGSYDTNGPRQFTSTQDSAVLLIDAQTTQPPPPPTSPTLLEENRRKHIAD